VLARQMPWVVDVPPMLVHFIGACEIAGAAGLVLPGLTGVQPGLTPVAAVGLMVLMTLASLFHFGRGEFPYMVLTMTVAVIAAFVGWGRATHSSARRIDLRA
jgi:putative oxidoreductase